MFPAFPAANGYNQDEQNVIQGKVNNNISKILILCNNNNILHQ